MALNETSTFPASLDAFFAAIASTDKLGTANKEGNRVANLIKSALTNIEGRMGVSVSTDVSSIEARLRGYRSGFTPTLFANGATAPATMSGGFTKQGLKGDVLVKGRVTGAWSGTASPCIEVGLPNGWTADPALEGAALLGWAASFPSLGAHSPLVGVVHPGSTRIRFICPFDSGKLFSRPGPGYMSAAAATDVLTCPAAHLLANDTPVRCSAAGPTWPTGLVLGTTYYVRDVTATTLKLAATVGGAAINITADAPVHVEVAPENAQTAAYWLAMNGGNVPFAMTGDGTGSPTYPNDDLFHVAGTVYLQ